MSDAVLLGAMVTLSLGLVEVMKILLEKFTGSNKEKMNASNLNLRMYDKLVQNDEKITNALQMVSATTQKAIDTLDRIERQQERLVEKMEDERIERVSYYNRANSSGH